MTDVDSSD